MATFQSIGAAIVATVGVSVVLAQQNGAAPGTLATPHAPPVILLSKVVAPPAWAFTERAMLDAAVNGVQLWMDRYVNANGSLNIEEHWGVTDGPDDIMEDIRGWPLVYALGAPESVIQNFEKVWEGHLRQFGRAKVPEVEMAKDGVYVKEFPASFDWEHNGEGLQAFYWYGLSRPDDPVSRTRARRFAGLYMGEDRDAANYDPQHKIIKSLFNGSKGPVLRPVTPVDWDGPENPQRAARFKTSSNIRGDHPLNLLTTTLAAHAYLLTHDQKYKKWLLEYVDAWRDRAAANGGNFPSNIGLDGTVGGEWAGKWYGGIFGWNSPDDGLRNYVLRGVPVAFGEAALLTGNLQYVETIRRQVDNIFAAKRVENGKVLVPHYYGEKDGKVGWYGYRDGEFFPTGALGNLSDTTVELYLWSLSRSDLDRILPNPPDRRSVQGWIDFLQGKNAAYPVEAMQDEFRESARIADRMRDQTAGYGPSPVAFESLVNLTLGGNNLYGSGDVLHSQVRYFDPERRRAGLAEDVAALVEKIEPDAVTVYLSNTSAVKSHRLVVQMGAYGEHQAVSVSVEGKATPVDAPTFDVLLAAGAGAELKIAVRRYVNDPTLAFPWDRGWWDNQPSPAGRGRGAAANSPAGTGGR